MDDAARRARWPQKLAIGRVVKPHGVRGEVSIEAWGEFVRHLGPEANIWLAGEPRKLLGLRGSGGKLIGTFEHCADRDAAEGLRGSLIEIQSSVLPTPDGEDLYLFELEGCEVCVEDRENQSQSSSRARSKNAVGKVQKVIEDGGGLLLEVRREGELECRDTFLVPFVKAYLRRQDLEAGELLFDLPEGLLETCVSTS